MSIWWTESLGVVDIYPTGTKEHQFSMLSLNYLQRGSLRGESARLNLVLPRAPAWNFLVGLGRGGAGRGRWAGCCGLGCSFEISTEYEGIFVMKRVWGPD